MIELRLGQVNIGVGDGAPALSDDPEEARQGKLVPTRVMHLQDPQSGIIIVVPFSLEAAREIGHMLANDKPRIEVVPGGALSALDRLKPNADGTPAPLHPVR